MALFDFLRTTVVEKVAAVGTVAIGGKTYAITDMGVSTFVAAGAAGIGAGKKVTMDVSFKDAKEALAFRCEGTVSRVTGKDATLQYVNLPDARKQHIARILARRLINK